MDIILMEGPLEYNQLFGLIALCLAVLRVYLELINFDWNRLPISKLMAKQSGEEYVQRFHRWGLIFSIGYIALMAPSMLLS